MRGEADVEALLDAWRIERTSELAKAICAVALPQLDDFLARIDATRWNDSWTFDDAAMNARAAAFIPFTREIATWREWKPDPRVFDAALKAIMCSDANNWFRGDQVAHVIPQPKVDDAPSFADHALALLEAHAGEGSPAALERAADLLLIEAACDEAEMAARLGDLARELRQRSSPSRKK